MIEATARLSNWDPGIQMRGWNDWERTRFVEFACDFRTVEITKNGLIFCENCRKIWVVAPEKGLASTCSIEPIPRMTLQFGLEWASHWQDWALPGPNNSI